MLLDAVDVTIVVVGSEGRISRSLARGLEYIEFENAPLDAKYDAGIEYCRKFDPDAVCLIGSDDFISPGYWSWAAHQIVSGWDLVGLLDFYIVDLLQHRILYWGGYQQQERKGESIAAGRVYSKRILDHVNWKPYGCVTGYKSCFQDDERALASVVHKEGRIRSINMAAVGCRYWAVKTGDEFNSVGAFESQYPTVNITDNSWMLFRSETQLDLY